MTDTDTNMKELAHNFESILEHYLASCNSIKANVNLQKQAPELEIRFGTNSKHAKMISVVDYQNVVSSLLENNWKSTTPNMKGNQMLRIIPERLDSDMKDYNTNEKKRVPPTMEGPSPEYTDQEKLLLKKDEQNNTSEFDSNNNQYGGKSTRHRIRMSSIRAEIEGISNIQDYCQHNDLEKVPNSFRTVKFTKKSRVINPKSGNPFEMVDYIDHNFRVAYMEEEEFKFSSNYAPIKRTIYEWTSSRKTFRSINRVRFQHEDYPVFVDISIVKTNKKLKYRNGKTGPPNPSETIQESDVFNTVPVYEIELELDNTRVKTYDVQSLMKSVKNCVRHVLSGLQETPYPIPYSEQDWIIKDYMCRLFTDSWLTSESPFPYFIGPQNVSLQLENIVSNDEDEMSSNISICKDYTVTEKADGLRALLYVSRIGKVYMITGNMKVIFTGSRTKEKGCWDSLLDGEFIMYGKNPEKKRLFMYAAFDIYYFGGMQKHAHVRPLPFSTNDETALEDKYRYSLLKKFHSMCKLESVTTNAQCMFHIRCKHFEQTDGENMSIQQASAAILSRQHDYETDGLIYTPMNTGVGSDKPDDAHELNGKKFTWSSCFKWKPPEYNTIDFLVETQKDKDGQDLIRYIAHDGDNMMKNIIPYKTLILRVGFDKKKHQHMNPFHDMLYDNDDYMKNLVGTNMKEDNSQYVALPFVPTVPYEQDAYLCHIELEKDIKEKLQMKTIEGDIFQEDTIVEFKYLKDDKNKKGPWKWVPLRVRQDKTQSLREGKKSMNNYTTADTNWRSIHYPVTEGMLTGTQKIPHVEVTDTIYYNLTEKSQSTTGALRDFHNIFIKRKLIGGVASFLRNKMKISEPILIDYGVGKGGDLAKWSHAKLKFVFGIDIHEDNIINQHDGACVRYLRWRHKNKNHPLRALFLEGNSSLNIRVNGTAFRKSMHHEISQSVFGQSKNPNKKYVFSHGIAKEGFHISSCMFALHYFFENTKTLHSFLKNLAECTRLHGYFIGACFDGAKIFEFLHKRDNGTFIQQDESVRIDKNGRKMFEITKMYESILDKFPGDDSSVGLPILVYQESIDKHFTEYLVNFEYFIRMMENYGFVLVDKNEARSMGFTESSGLFNRLYGMMQYDIQKDEDLGIEYRNAPLMSSFEKTVSFLNRYFIFKKVRELSQTTLNQMEKVLETKEKEENEELEEQKTEEIQENEELEVKKTEKIGERKGRRKLVKTKIKLDQYSPDNE
jgi:hypothetical protein